MLCWEVTEETCGWLMPEMLIGTYQILMAKIQVHPWVPIYHEYVWGREFKTSVLQKAHRPDISGSRGYSTVVQQQISDISRNPAQIFPATCPVASLLGHTSSLVP